MRASSRWCRKLTAMTLVKAVEKILALGEEDRKAVGRLLRSTVIDESGCWILSPEGDPETYGSVRYRGKTWKAHQVSVIVLKEEKLDPDLVVDHLCRKRRCWRPDHLEQVTQKVNVHRGYRMAELATHCAKGHPWNEETEYWRPNGRRGCRICNRLMQQEVRRKRKIEGWTSPVFTHCPNGHEMTDDNLYLHADGVRRCKKCVRQRQNDYYRRQKNARA